MYHKFLEYVKIPKLFFEVSILCSHWKLEFNIIFKIEKLALYAFQKFL